MGFQAKTAPPLAPVVFDGEYEGLEVTYAARGSIAMLRRLNRIRPDSPVEDDALALEQFGDECLVDWNLEYSSGPHQGEPVPATGAGLLSVSDPALVMAVVNKWVEVRATPGAPLAEASPAGSTSPGA